MEEKKKAKVKLQTSEKEEKKVTAYKSFQIFLTTPDKMKAKDWRMIIKYVLPLDGEENLPSFPLFLQ